MLKQYESEITNAAQIVIDTLVEVREEIRSYLGDSEADLLCNFCQCREPGHKHDQTQIPLDTLSPNFALYTGGLMVFVSSHKLKDATRLEGIRIDGDGIDDNIDFKNSEKISAYVRDEMLSYDAVLRLKTSMVLAEYDKYRDEATVASIETNETVLSEAEFARRYIQK